MAVANDSAIVLGLITPFGTDLVGVYSERAVKLAQEDFTMSVPGIPSFDGSGMPRPVIFVSCDEFAYGPAGAIRGAQHLVNDLQVPIILGPYSNAMYPVYSEVLLPGGTMELSPNFPFDLFYKLGPNPAAPNPLFWRMSSDNGAQAPLLSAFIRYQLEPQLVTLGI
jgi:hypothetical protein